MQPGKQQPNCNARARSDSQPHRPEGAVDGWMVAAAQADAGAVNCADVSKYQAASNTSDPRPPQRVPDMNSPSAPQPEPRTSPENEPEQDDRAARLGGLLARADQAAQRIAVQRAERHASSDYAARMELEAQTQGEPENQARARDEAELELLRLRRAVRRPECGIGFRLPVQNRNPVSRKVTCRFVRRIKNLF
jgi:hypothetical protein